MQPAAIKTLATLLLFSLTLLTSACITFMMQPMVGKMLLPIVGGTPAGWMVAMAFFQIMLLAGYLLAHTLSKLSPRGQACIYLGCLLAGAWFLPLSLAGYNFEKTPEAFDVFMLLTKTIGIPFIALSATSSTIQRLFTTTGHHSAEDPYFLYAASNLGSFGGLLAYPFLVEPAFSISGQQHMLFYAYVTLMALGFVCILLSGRKAEPVTTQQAAREPAPTKLLQLQWLCLSFIPSSLLMAVTAYITMDVISVPMIWVLPLALYLLTFVIAFSKKPFVSLAVMDKMQPLAIFVGIVFITVLRGGVFVGWVSVIVYLAIFTIVTLACHMRLVSKRPSENYLTGFYLMMAAGGALGGVLNAFIIPAVLDNLGEFPLLLLASFLVHPAFRFETKLGKWIFGLLILSIALVNAQAPQFGIDHAWARMLMIICITVPIFALLPKLWRQMTAPAPVVLASLLISLFAMHIIGDDPELLSKRNFFGTIKVIDYNRKIDGQKELVRVIRHGSTIHGVQSLEKGKELTPLAYYNAAGPFGDVFSILKPRHVAVLGLGAGSINCFANPKRDFTFFEIDPDIVTTARNYFPFLEKCISAKPPRIIVGDGRLELAKLQEKFDIIILDAFTSDSIPTHILTEEALKMYLQHLNKNGTIVLNVSNRYFVLWNMIANTAANLDMTAQLGANVTGTFQNRSVWVILNRKGEESPSFAKQGWKTVRPDNKTKPWTDDYSNLLGMFSLSVGSQLPK
ncbi:MAG: fused MFS/spermidine synthase [Micavibrio sp.]|nr:fused MFS/spermidine synthase [Micavibrio sp.]